MKYKLLFIGIIVIASVLRLWGLGSVPPSPDWDEASIGYNAYSILQTGRDEYGEFMPLIMRSFGDYKPALYVYFVVPFVVLFDVSLLAVRLPSALFGILTVIAVYYLLKSLTKKESIALVTAFLLAMSPWHIQFSRIGFESNMGLAFNVFTVLFFIYGLKRPWMLMLSALFASSNFYVYQSEKVFTPLLVLLLLAIYWKKIFAIKRKIMVIAPIIVGIIVITPFLIYTIQNPQSLTRAQSTSVFQADKQLVHTTVQRLDADQKNNDFLGTVLDNRRFVYMRQVANGYLSHFDLNWLFVTGDNPRHHAPFMGNMYLVEFPFLLIGIYALIFYHSKYVVDRRALLLIFGWFLITPIPASITYEVPHAVRTLNFLPTFQIFVAIGLIHAYMFVLENKELRIKNFVLRNMLYSCFLILASVNVGYFLNQYFVQQNYFYSQHWQYGYQELVQQTESLKKDYDSIVVDNRVPMDQSHIFFLYYTQFSPQQYQEEQGALNEHHAFDKYTFRSVDTKNLEDGTLYVIRAEDISEEQKKIVTVHFLDGTPAYAIISR